MKILLVSNFLGDQQESMLRFADVFEAMLPDHGVEVDRIAPRPGFTRLIPRYRYDGVPKYLGYLDKFIVFPRQLRRYVRSRKPTIVHLVDHASAVYAQFTDGVPTLATCHDLLQIRASRGEIPQQVLGAGGRRFQAWILRQLAKVPDLACISTKTAEDLLRLAPRPAERLHVILNGLNHSYAPVSFPEAERMLAQLKGSADWLHRTGGFYLHVGGPQWYKNRTGLLRIQASLIREGALSPPALVIVGKPLSMEDEQLADELGLGPHRFQLSDVSSDQLAALYSRANGLVFPSLEEGFGWPVAEAHACGCPVFTSDRAPLTEVGGDAAKYFNPEDPEEAARVIRAAVPFRAELRSRGLARAAFWAPSRMLNDYISLYRQLGARAAAAGTQ